MKKDRVYTELQTRFLEALSDKNNKGDIKKCMNIAGYNSDQSTTSIVNSLSEEIIDIANKLIAAHTVQATWGIIGVISDPDTLNAKNILDGAKQILDRAGVVKKDNEVRLGVGSGLVILPAKKSEEDD